MDIKIYNQLEELMLIADQWDELSLQSPQQNPQMSHAWLSCYFSIYGDETQWFVVVAFEQNQIIAILPLVVRQAESPLGKIQFLQLPKNDHTLSVDAVVKENCQTVLNVMHEAAFKYCPSAVYIEYSRIDSVSDNCKWFKDHEGLKIQTDVNAFGYSIGVQESYDLYYAQLSKNHRSNLNRWSNKLKQFEKYEVVFSGEDNPEYFQDLFGLEHSGWKGKAKTSVMSNQKALKYFHSLAHSLSQKGWLCYQFLKVNDAGVAGNFSIQFNKTQLLWKLAYDDEYAKMSPGSLLMLKVIENAIACGYKIDLMTNESWYENWNMQKREFIDIKIFNRSPKAAGLMILQKIRSTLSTVKKKYRNVAK